MWERPGFWLAVATKGVLTAILLLSIVEPALRDYSHRGIVGRAAAAVIALVLVPAWWLSWGRRRHSPYPHAIDALLPLPFIVDYTTSALDLGRFAWWDPVVHALNFATLGLVFLLLLLWLGLDGWAAAGSCLAAGVITAILWELLEHVVFETRSPTLVDASAVEDLLVALAAVGVTTAVVLVVRRWRCSRERRRSR